MIARRAELLLLLGLSCSAPARAADIVVHEAWIDPGPPETQVPAAYLDIENTGASPRSVTLRATVAESISIYRARYNADAAVLERLPKLQLPPHTRLRFQDSDMLAMLYGLNHALKPDEKVNLLIDTDDGRHLTVPAQVRPAAPAAAKP